MMLSTKGLTSTNGMPHLPAVSSDSASSDNMTSVRTKLEAVVHNPAAGELRVAIMQTGLLDEFIWESTVVGRSRSSCLSGSLGGMSRRLVVLSH